MERGAAGHQVDPLQARQPVGDGVELGQAHPASFPVDPLSQGLSQSTGLLVDFFLHEVPEAGLLGQDGVPADLLRHRGPLLAVGIGNRDSIAVQDRHLSVGQENGRAGIGQDGQYVRGDEVLPLAHAHHHRGSLAGHHDLFGVVRADHRQSESPAQLGHRSANRQGQVALQVGLNQVSNHFAVGLAGKGMAAGAEALLQRQVVLDDSVVHHGQVPPAVDVRMRVGFAGRAVGGPAGVADAVGAVQSGGGECAFEVGQLPGRATHLQTFAVDDGYPGRVVAAVFQPLQALQENRHHRPAAYVTHYPAHAFPSTRPLTVQLPGQ